MLRDAQGVADKDLIVIVRRWMMKKIPDKPFKPTALRTAA